MIPEITIEQAEQLSMTTDYACFAVGEINEADAGAFFLEGYNYASKLQINPLLIAQLIYTIEEQLDPLHPIRHSNSFLKLKAL